MENKNLTALHDELVSKESNEITNKPARYHNYNKYDKDKKWMESVPKYLSNLVRIIRNNTEIRRFTSIGIINYLKQKGEITTDNNKPYINFLWNKFQVKANGLTREYPYHETFFINCFAASFTSFSAAAQRTINIFVKEAIHKNFDTEANQNEINNIIKSIDEYVNENNIDNIEETENN